MAEETIIVDVDPEKCRGHGLCNVIAPDIFTLDESGFCTIGSMEIGNERKSDLEQGVANCPEMAITIREEQIPLLREL